MVKTCCKNLCFWCHDRKK